MRSKPATTASKMETDTSKPRTRPLTRYTRERVSSATRIETENKFTTKLAHSWIMKQSLSSITTKDRGTFTIASGQSISEYDVGGNIINTIYDNLPELSNFMKFAIVSNTECLLQFYEENGRVLFGFLGKEEGNEDDEEDDDDEDDDNDDYQINLPGINPCIRSFTVLGMILFYQKTEISVSTNGKSAVIAAMDFTKNPPALTTNINSGMKMVRSFHCFHNFQNQLQIVVANKDAYSRSRSTHPIALKSFNKQGAELWTIARNQSHATSDFRYDLRTIAADRRHLFVLDYSVGAVHMITHAGTCIHNYIDPSRTIVQNE